MGKRVSCYMNKSDLQILDDFCRTHNCSQSSALKGAFLGLKVEPSDKLFTIVMDSGKKINVVKDSEPMITIIRDGI